MAVRIVNKFIDLHSCVGRNAERTSINEKNAEFAVSSCLDYVTTVDQITDLGLAAVILGQIGLKYDGNGMSNPNCACGGEDLTDRIWVEPGLRCTSVLAPCEINTEAKGQ